MNKIYFLIGLAIVLASCGEGENPAEKKLRVYENSALSSDWPYVTAGNNLVFHYYYKAADQENIADDEFAEDFFLEVANFQDDFSFDSNTPLQSLYSFTHLYRAYCYCILSDTSHVNSFSISAEKLKDGWRVSGDFDLKVIEGLDGDGPDDPYTYDKTLEISGTYKTSSRPSNN